ncbi:MAG: HEPN domain-containing protein [Candidatus Methanoperedens sp.]|nr:HEPN domain-containing protein [Candidatus Methanoperedens sp.]MCZ7369859.1 HEPN domain-containing protein [Candidatus Methanoperedens sp.]
MKMAECFQKGLLKRTTPDMENALRSLELSRSNIEDAAENMSIHRYRVVAILSYTAMFHAARAILSRDGIKERSHECIPVYLKEKYSQLETLANILDSYRRFRHDAIYGLDFAIDEKEAKAALDSAKEFLEKIRIFISEKEYGATV